MIDAALCEAVQQRRTRRATTRHRVATEQRSPWALSGLATCAHCGRSLLANGNSRGRRRVLCSGRIQGLGCTAPSFFAEMVEGQIGDALMSFALPTSAQAELIGYWTRQQRAATTTAPTRATVERRLARLKEAYLAGDIDRADWQTRQAPLARELDALPADLPANDQIARRLAGYFADVASAWQAATPEERNGLARALFSDVVIEDRTAIAVLPRPEFRPFFMAMGKKKQEPGVKSHPAPYGIGGSDGDPLRGCILPPGSILFDPIPARRSAGPSRRDTYQRPRARRLSIDQEAVLLLTASGRTLRDLAVTFGVSHETVRKTLRQGRQNTPPIGTGRGGSSTGSSRRTSSSGRDPI